MQLDFGFKFCTKCKTEKLLNEFYKQTLTKDGLANYCITCKKQIYKQTYSNFCQQNSARSRKFYKQNKDRVLKQRKEYRKNSNYPKLSRSLRKKFFRVIKSRTSEIHPLFKVSGEYLALSLEKQFKPQMNWSNKQDWIIKFKKQLHNFNLNDPQEIAIAFSIGNIELIWKKESSLSPST